MCDVCQRAKINDYFAFERGGGGGGAPLCKLYQYVHAAPKGMILVKEAETDTT